MGKLTYAGIEFDGSCFNLYASGADGTIASARLSVGSHSDADHDAAVAALRQDYATLRQWAADAQATYNDWPNKTAVQKDAIQREVIRRLGVFFAHFGDLLVLLNADL